MTNVLLLTGIGLNETLVSPILHQLSTNYKEYKFHWLELPGFAGKALPRTKSLWEYLIGTVAELIEGLEYEEWVIYGQGAGAALALEWASRNFEFSVNKMLMPEKIVLHSAIVPDFHLGPFSGIGKISKTAGGIFTKFLDQQLLNNSFIHPQNIEDGTKAEFIKACRAATLPEVADEIINKSWMESVKFKVESHRLCFLNGDLDPGSSSKLFIQTKSNFPGAEIKIVKDWKLYPIIEKTNFFNEYLVNDLLLREKKNENILPD